MTPGTWLSKTTIAALLATYALAWAVAAQSPGRAILSLNLLTATTLLYFLVQIWKGIWKVILSAVLLALSLTFPPLLLVVAIVQWALLLSKLAKFFRNARFVPGSMVLYSALLLVPTIAKSVPLLGHAPHAVVGLAMAALGAAAMLLVLFVYGKLGNDGATTAIYTMGYGWYVLVFAIMLLLPGADGADSGDADY